MMKKFFVPETEAQRQVRAIAAELESIRFRLLGVRAGLDAAGELEADAAAEIRAVVECVISDFLDSAIRDLRMVGE